MSLKDEYFCPHCGSTLNEQSGFDPENGTWTCTECGQELYGDDVYDGDIFPGVMWYCDECGTLLNKQNGFSDSCPIWFCAKCGYMNTISEENIFESKEDKMRATLFEEYDENDEEDEYDGNNNDDDDNDNSCIRVYTDRANSKASAQTWVGIALLLFFLVVVPVIMVCIHTETPLSSKECIGKDYEVIVRQFQDAGFKNIECIPVEDLKDGLIFKDTNKVNTVQSISIKGNTKFKKGKEYYKRDAITLYYHVYPTDQRAFIMFFHGKLQIE